MTQKEENALTLKEVFIPDYKDFKLMVIEMHIKVMVTYIKQNAEALRNAQSN